MSHTHHLVLSTGRSRPSDRDLQPASSTSSRRDAASSQLPHPPPQTPNPLSPQPSVHPIYISEEAESPSAPTEPDGIEPQSKVIFTDTTIEALKAKYATIGKVHSFDVRLCVNKISQKAHKTTSIASILLGMQSPGLHDNIHAHAYIRDYKTPQDPPSNAPVSGYPSCPT